MRTGAPLYLLVFVLANTAGAEPGVPEETPVPTVTEPSETSPSPGPQPVQNVDAPGPAPREPAPETVPLDVDDDASLAAPRAPLLAERLHLVQPRAANYNAADPSRSWPNVGRALASVGVANALVWHYDWIVGEEWAFVTRQEIERNLETGFRFDGNNLATNFLSHPYQGSAYFNVARASGLDFWESTPFVFLGSATWEVLGESEAPSTNDLLATTLGGIVLGEILYRLSSDVLDDSSFGMERFLREFFGLLISPGRGIERLADGKAFRTGEAPDQRRLRHLAIDVGVDRVLLVQDEALRRYRPRPLVALQLEYGDLLPKGKSRTLGPFESFDLYAALNIGRVQELGAQVYAQGLLVGYSFDLGAEQDERRDNDVIGLVQSFDYRGAHVAQFGGMGLGPANVVLLRFDAERRLRIGTDLQWLVVGGSSSPRDGASERGYNYLTGITAGQELRLEMGAFGELGFRAKQYAAVVTDGESGEEFIGHTRLWYEVDVVSGVGLGVSPNLVHRLSRYDAVRRIALAQLET